MKLTFLTFGGWLAETLAGILSSAIGTAIDAMMNMVKGKVTDSVFTKALRVLSPGAAFALDAVMMENPTAKDGGQNLSTDYLKGELESNKAKLMGGWEDFLKKRKDEIAKPFEAQPGDKGFVGPLPENFRFSESAADKASVAKPELQFAGAILANSDEAAGIEARFRAQTDPRMDEKLRAEEEAAKRQERQTEVLEQIKELIAAGAFNVAVL